MQQLGSATTSGPKFFSTGLEAHEVKWLRDVETENNKLEIFLAKKLLEIDATKDGL